MVAVSRRDFIKLGSASLIALAGSASLQGLLNIAEPASAFAAISTDAREYLMLCDTHTDVKDRNAAGIRVTNPGLIRGLDVASGETFTVDLPFYGHTVTQNQGRPQQVVTFEKWGTRGALVDVHDKSVMEIVQPAPGNTFFGHAAFNANGTIAFTTEDTYKASTGQLVIRDASNLKMIQKISSYGIKPHQCITSPDQKTLIVVNQGLKSKAVVPNLAWIDIVSGKLIKKVELTVDSNVGYSHLDLSFDGWACVGGISSSKATSVPVNLVTFVSPAGDAFVPPIPADLTERLHGEALSIAFLGKTGLVAVTVPAANLLLILNYKGNALVEVLDMPKPTGIVPNANNLDACDGVLVSCKPDKNLFLVSDKTGHASMTVARNDFGGLGAHLTRLYL